MSFGGFFGGGSGSSSSSSNNNNSSSSSSTSLPSTPSPFSSQSSNESSAIRQRLQNAVSTQATIANARELISKINKNCFNHCVPAPSSSLSSKEQACLSSCMEKYIESWNVVSRTYMTRLHQEGANAPSSGGAAASVGSGGKELF